ncbi:hypothetical protein [Komagataeibacter swingsii]|uniref:Uncharacterized protein n=1 Tax=Komagataeibacter swingsii TaxID=215220 RepID=A0A850P1U0_9PROT|nr:hypothetical protein [Komagataeibacter swingsii]NVN36789.1 hypothetical protein [Komagataeibacter swingsii]
MASRTRTRNARCFMVPSGNHEAGRAGTALGRRVDYEKVFGEAFLKSCKKRRPFKI